ncbi:hypothetical protein BN2475_690003 [Paraburkholderia ribeironis]|uniref:Uncharacterized protein n=1 Tax=Paraburkholderia ribeironis TaxID=1247936 RepID=A0A1N7SGZ8_9BURK|nr:hypothetical protein BN2475_690003 [Paraburkholderia ribeironis]
MAALKETERPERLGKTHSLIAIAGIHRHLVCEYQQSDLPPPHAIRSATVGLGRNAFVACLAGFGTSHPSE